MNLTGQIFNLKSILISRIRVWTILAGLLFAGTYVSAATYYIDPSSTSTATPDGSLDKPFTSWDDVTWVANSTYLQKRGTTCEASKGIKPPVDYITLGAYGTGARPIIKSLIGDRAKAIEFGNKSITVKDLEVYSTNDIVCAILLGGEGPHVINNCVLHDCSWGIRVFNLAGKLTISNSEIYDTGDDGIYTEDTEDIDIFGCHIHHVNSDLPIRETAGGDCIQITGQQGNLHIYNNYLDHSAFGRKFCLIIGSAYTDNDTPHKALVENNVMIGYQDSEEVTSGVYLKATIEHLTFRYNTVKNAATGIWLNAKTTAYNNVFIGCSEGVTINSGIEAEIYNNTFYNNVIGVGTNYGSIGYLYNNVFVRGSKTEKYLSLFGDITTDKNCFNVEGTGLFNGFNTLKEYQAEQSRDVNSFVGDPDFVNLAKEDFHIKSTSVCKDKAKVLKEITRDKDGTPVPFGNGPDIGAYEYSDQANTNPDTTTDAGNKPPHVYVNYSRTAAVGVVSTIDASESYDTDGEALTYTWIAPEGISLSSESSPTIEIMPDDDLEPDVYTLQLKVSDGENTESKLVELNVVPFNPNTVELKVASIAASSYQVPNYPENLYDDDPDTRWASQGMNEWVLFELESPAYIDFIKLAFFNGDDRTAYFDVSASIDNENWEPLMTDYKSCGFSVTKQAYPLAESKASKQFKYIKITGFCNSQNDWNSFTEFKAYGSYTQPSKVSDENSGQFSIYPNPASDFVTFQFDNQIKTAALQILDLNGKVVTEGAFNNSSDFQLGIESLQTGIYFIRIIADDKAYETQRLVIQ